MGSSTSKTSSTQQTSVQQPSIQQIVLPELVCPVVNINSASSECGLFSNLPKELLIEFVKWLSDKDLLLFAMTCKSVHERISDDAFWIQLLTYRDTSLVDENYPKTKFSLIKYWYFCQKNKLSPQILPQESIPSGQSLSPKKVVLIGTVKTGKTELMRVLCGVEFVGSYTTTIGVEFMNSYWSYKSSYQKIQVWDTAGRERFRSAPTAYYRGAHILFLVYSVANRESFEKIDQYFKDALSSITYCHTIVLVANFQDVPKEEHQVTSEEGQEWANKRNSTISPNDNKPISVYFVEVSAKTRKGVRTLRRVIAETYVEPPPVREAVREIKAD